MYITSAKTPAIRSECQVNISTLTCKNLNEWASCRVMQSWRQYTWPRTLPSASYIIFWAGWRCRYVLRGNNNCNFCFMPKTSSHSVLQKLHCDNVQANARLLYVNFKRHCSCAYFCIVCAFCTASLSFYSAARRFQLPILLYRLVKHGAMLSISAALNLTSTSWPQADKP